MIRKTIAAILLATASVAATQAASTIQHTENFSTDPASRWNVFGDATRFQWNSSSQSLEVAWDSSKPKSFYYVPAGRTLTRYDSFTFEFDLTLDDLSSGHEAGKTGPMQIGIGFLNFSATNASWSRANWGMSPNVAEFNIYPSGYFPGYGTVDATMLPSFVASNGNGYLASTAEFIINPPINQVIHVSMVYDGELQALTAVWTTNGVPVGQPHRLVLGKEVLISSNEDYEVNMFSISNYESSPWDSVLAHGRIDNISFTIPPTPPIANLSGGFVGDTWRMTFHSLAERTYDLLRSTDLSSWQPVEENVAGNGGTLALRDLRPPAGNAFYRVRAN